MDIAASTILAPTALREILANALPSCSVQVTDSDFGAPPADVVVAIIPNESEFPLGLGVVVSLAAGVSLERWLLELARRISIAASCQTIGPGIGLGDDASPYWSVVWDNGVPHLADDCNSMLGDGEGGPVQLIRRLELTLPEFAGSGFCAVVQRRPRGSP